MALQRLIKVLYPAIPSNSRSAPNTPKAPARPNGQALARRLRRYSGGILFPTVLLTLTACAMPDDAPTVRHFASTAFHEGTPFHIFVFDPDEPRPLATRIRIARNQIRAEPGCDWVETPTQVIADATLRQGTPWSDTLLAAPVKCT